ncbi:hypothetical protein Salat_0685000 [Sesamum alatum]|uniref:Uncharacterized protein n=1 Tax=Sesamum alatum TaxID=300844 RepID=A0AAE1YS74_9LAMI|nr:hypothetical protein Salat_0685000 [Sesamum alatum]
MTDPGFLPIVVRIWQHPVVGTSMFVVTRKLKALKCNFRNMQRREGGLAINTEQSQEFLCRLHVLVQAFPRVVVLHEMEKFARLRFAKAVTQENNMARQRVKTT